MGFILQDTIRIITILSLIDAYCTKGDIFRAYDDINWDIWCPLLMMHITIDLINIDSNPLET